MTKWVSPVVGTKEPDVGMVYGFQSFSSDQLSNKESCKGCRLVGFFGAASWSPPACNR